jgi:hypothetical protein
MGMCRAVLVLMGYEIERPEKVLRSLASVSAEKMSSPQDVPTLSPSQIGTEIGTLSQDGGISLLVDSLQVQFFQVRWASTPLAVAPSVAASERPPSAWRYRVFAP